MSSDVLGKSILDVAATKGVPLVAFLELTNRCNLDCIHCMRSKDVSGELAISQFNKVISELAEIGCLNIIFTGGEPLLSKGFFEIVSHARNEGFNINISSNGIEIDEDIVKKLKLLKPLSVKISIYGSTPGVHDQITKTPGSYYKTINALRLLRKNGIKVQAHMMVMKQNFCSLDAVRKMFMKQDIDFSYDFVIYPGPGGSKEALRCRITDAQLDRARREGFVKPEEFMGIENKRGDFRNIDDIATVSCRVSSRGEVFPSGTLRIGLGNVNEGKFCDIWSGSKSALRLRKLKMPDFECASCEKSSKCSWDIGLAYEEHGSVTSTPKEWCRLIGKEN